MSEIQNQVSSENNTTINNESTNAEASIDSTDKSLSVATDESQDNKAQGNVEKRIASYVKRAKIAENKVREAENKARLAEERLANYAKLNTNSESPFESNKPQKPDRTEFRDPMDYADAIAEYYENLNHYNLRKAQHDSESQRLQHLKESIDEEHAQRVSEFTKKISLEEFEKAISKYIRFLTPAHVMLIQKSPRSAELAYYLGENTEEAEELASLNPMDAAIKIGELTAALSQKTQKSTDTIATEPLVTISSGGKANTVNSMNNGGDRITNLCRQMRQYRRS